MRPSLLCRSLTLALVLLTLLAAPVAGAQMVSVNRATINMRSGPGKNYAVLWELGKGFPLKVLARKGNWLKVRDFEGDQGWVYKTLVARRPHLIVKKKVINIRSKPTTRSRIVGKATYGVVLRTMKRARGWVKVRHENGLTGWAKRELLWGW